MLLGNAVSVGTAEAVFAIPGAMMSTQTQFNPRLFRDVLGTFLTGVTVVTTRDADGMAHGVTANSFSSVSLDPPLVLWSQAYTSKSFAAFRDSDHFAINILAHDQIPLSNHFAKSTENKFAEITHRNGLGGAPILDGAVAHLECVKHAAYPAGDHVIYIGRVEHFASSLKRPLAFGAGKYLLARSHDLESGNTVPIPVAPAAIASMVRALAGLRGKATISLAVWANHGPTIVYWQPGSEASEEFTTGQVVSPTQSATGLAFAAFAPAPLIKPFLEEDLRLHPHVGRVAETDDLAARRTQIEAQLAGIRETGYASLSPETVAVPLYSREGALEMVVTLTNHAWLDAEASVRAIRDLKREQAL